ncbi:hypothetical protein EHI47_04410 [Rhizobium leguminosarum]|uniref:Uncharacterized protein n=2 Tax=Rhizobium TaxID=379 RepID=A0A444I9V3_RHILE|nr:hypothetical protein EHI45_00640 [Rhizobium leguminosarum]TBE73806.1 hypothetical protein ELH03_22065 [Rhizobium beringeri]RWX35652.1 hypothetical protein EHI47_04410 [Rhizobium leguminosarum]TBC75884.1 hypothetical protein ELH27_22075 [Rhizobium leguminosarum]TBC97202.1 hypothetical protein ELH26_22835 [Rhizobium leguminosarum]
METCAPRPGSECPGSPGFPLPADAPTDEILTLQGQGLSRASRAWQIRLSPNWCLSDPHFFQQSVIVVQVATWKSHVLFCVLIHGLHLGQPNEK